MVIDYAGFAQPKPIGRKTLKARAKRQHADRVSEVREYVFEREHGWCRCCETREADSMHEIRPRSLGGKVSRHNSIALCGSGTTGCHGLIQSHKVEIEGSQDAEQTLHFVPLTNIAADWLKIPLGQQIASAPYPKVAEL